MKKLIALFLAIVMTFSFAAVAFAAEGDITTTAPATTEENDNPLSNMTEEEVMDFIMNMDLREVGFILHVAKIGIKIAFVLDTLGFIDLSPIKNAILDAVWSIISGFIGGEDEAGAATPTTTAAAVA